MQSVIEEPQRAAPGAFTRALPVVLSPPLSVLAEGGTEKLSDLPKVTQLFLKEINLQSSLEGLMLKLKLQNFGHLVRRASSLEETLMLGNIESRERRGRQTMRWLDGITDSMNMNLKVEEEFEHKNLSTSPHKFGGW